LLDRIAGRRSTARSRSPGAVEDDAGSRAPDRARWLRAFSTSAAAAAADGQTTPSPPRETRASPRSPEDGAVSIRMISKCFRPLDQPPQSGRERVLAWSDRRTRRGMATSATSVVRTYSTQRTGWRLLRARPRGHHVHPGGQPGPDQVAVDPTGSGCRRRRSSGEGQGQAASCRRPGWRW